MKLKEIINKYGDYEINEEELEKLLAKPRLKTVWEMEENQIYLVIKPNGDVSYLRWEDDSFDRAMRNAGNIFLTKQEAEFESERRKIEAIMLKYGTRDMMSLGDENVKKYHIIYNHESDDLFVMVVTRCTSQGSIYFATEELAERVIDKIGKEKLKKYCFYVK